MVLDIVGGGGYIGKNFSNFLKYLNISHRIILRNGKKQEKKNILSFEQWLTESSSNVCIYLADPASIEPLEIDIFERAKKNFSLALNKESSVFIYLSSSKIYDKNIKNTISENSEISGKCLYTKLKVNNEKLIFNNHNENKIKSIVLRIPNLVCEFPKSKTLFYKINETNRKDICFLKGNYNFLNEFLYGIDLFEVIIKLLNSDLKNNLTFNVSPSQLTRVMDLLNPKFHYKSIPINSSKLSNKLLLSFINHSFHLPYYSIENNCIYWIKG